MTIPGYDYAQPTEKSLLTALTASVGADAARALTDLAVKKAGRRTSASTDDLVKMTEYLMELGDLVRVTARSEKIRAVTYRALHDTVK
ncbi:hypothetical protein ACWT_5776 [Actinoplanes sp. SE50]|uniref:hypothetical protein n=1 Tax=unclassified Actinoplanes TaxID=2626549 RepID=UPI00023ED685|nr:MULTISPECIES: hypothetical protein [unclassified Actinoplanes]AEV86794.1 hypothetical protein ACPL_5907 [Actinoplanes sp. SE50/110]ATO85191.1 hypothetical protein ACWT_5776 [Actinoplanes sp. SE50]SLM02601.1 hypothetical protein ACSP50_5883 [Actinoplanes sp. SE50/110]